VNSLQIKRSLFGNHNLRRKRETTIPMKKMGERDREKKREAERQRDRERLTLMRLAIA
jgi:hypothetical protein